MPPCARAPPFISTFLSLRAWLRGIARDNVSFDSNLNLRRFGQSDKQAFFIVKINKGFMLKTDQPNTCNFERIVLGL